MRSPSERTKGSRVRRTSFASHPKRAASLSRRALNFPRLNRRAVIVAVMVVVVVVVRCFLSLLSSAHAKSQRRPFLLSRRMYTRDEVIATPKGTERLPLSKEFKLLLDGLSLRRNLCFGNNIVQFQGSNAFYRRIRARSEIQFDDILSRCMKVASFKVFRIAESAAVLRMH